MSLTTLVLLAMFLTPTVVAASSFCINSCVQQGYELEGCVAYCDQQGSSLGLQARDSSLQLGRRREVQEEDRGFRTRREDRGRGRREGW